MNRREFLAETVAAASMIAMGDLNIVKANGNKLTAIVMCVDHVNGNNRIYPKAIIEEAIANFSYVLGELNIEHERSSEIIHLARVSHEITKLYLDGNYLKAEIEILNTPKGCVLKQMKNVAFRTVGIGQGKYNDKSELVISSYKLITIDAMPADKAASIFVES